ncbi:sigma-70 family RNA polymerase sigma factor [Levilactobacillus mulengensis]|mgnify:CR=1 FL=1|uniref:sigma-70 family RNA polymerase sigma factor n=1 Tax=Levilactobacillus mulengensis TaxID=2486025 RepID=UPI000F7B51D8|nr:sigma-70 family RNA polymerase sigma factor [Levilactobacillus mulengensis]
MKESPHAAAYRFLYDGDHEIILFAALKRLHMNRSHADYEDYLQEARLLFPEIYAAFPENPETKPHQFLAYAQQKIYWTLLDKLRRDRKQLERQEPGNQDELITAVASDDDILDAIGQADFRQYLLKVIGGAGTTGEWRYLVGTLLDQLTAEEIAARHSVSRNTVYKWRRSLIRRLVRNLTPPENFSN